MQTEMGGDTATRPVEDGAKSLAWAYTSLKVRNLLQSRSSACLVMAVRIPAARLLQSMRSLRPQVKQSGCLQAAIIQYPTQFWFVG